MGLRGWLGWVGDGGDELGCWSLRIRLMVGDLELILDVAMMSRGMNL